MSFENDKVFLILFDISINHTQLTKQILLYLISGLKRRWHAVAREKKKIKRNMTFARSTSIREKVCRNILQMCSLLCVYSFHAFYTVQRTRSLNLSSLPLRAFLFVSLCNFATSHRECSHTHASSFPDFIKRPQQLSRQINNASRRVLCDARKANVNLRERRLHM